ncbi:succinyl-CoA synthetase subunit beta [Variovorax sp. SRS16]|uniref:acetate--CoA ligase family protein n=1 Tax=Variovorax sp. SRS16 TaxID=282217 RepID=UPI001317D864|nr:acetate--CoA ligase family protein [Variovorax sp. SRS16]VTU24386.1 succinyl-CoA synthetase subunit beta [Variovorax sp. SRS16]
MPQSRGLFPASELRPLLDPGSVVVIDFSSKPSSFGARTTHNLADSGIQVFVVNPKLSPDAARGVFRSIEDLPLAVDCAIIAVPRDAVYEVASDCARKGIKGAIVYASGYAETGDPHHRELQEQLARLARDSGMHILGPNCIGILSAGGRLRMTFAQAPALNQPYPATIGLVSQSGGLGLALAQAARHGHAFSHVLTAGNSCDVDVADQIAYLVEDPDCRVIACLFEGMADPQRLLQAGRLAMKAGKPVIVHKLATGEEGMQAAMSHTGSLAGSAAVYRAAFEGHGIVEVDDFEALVETAAFFAKAGRPRATGVAALSTSGGATIMVADKAELHHVPLPQPGEAVSALLRSHIPEFGSARNPCDVTAQILSNPRSLPECASAMLADPAYGALVIPHPYAYAPGVERLKALEPVGRDTGKPICCVWLSQWLDGPGAIEVEASPCLALFRSMDRCMATLRAWHLYEKQFVLQGQQSRRLSETDGFGVLEAMMQPGATVLTESAAKRVLAAYGVPVVPERLVQNVAAAVDAARGLGGPVVLKVQSADVPHKTEAGGVRLDVLGDEQVRRAYEEILSSVARYTPHARIDGILVQPMVRRDLELIVGGRRDPLFGPTVVVGLGGIFVELLKDSVVALAPVSQEAARAMLDRLRGRALLDGFRGAPAVDVDLVASIVARVSELLADGADAIEELDLNPLVISDGRAVAVDALISLRPSATEAPACTGLAGHAA